MSFEDPTSRIGGPADTTTALPRPMSLANGNGTPASEPPGDGSAEPPGDSTDILSLDEMFGGQPQPAPPAAEPAPPAAESAPAPAEPAAAEAPAAQAPAAEAPAAQAPAAQAPPAEAAAAADAPTWTAMPVVPVRSEPVSPARPESVAPQPPQQRRQRSQLAGRVRTDAAAAWSGGMRRTQDWFRRGDNTLVVLTALVAIILIVAVFALGS